MKQILLPLFLLAGVTTQAKKYYISSSGENANNGLAPATAWKTIAKVNSFTFAANDSILFRRGDRFYGGIIVSRSDLNYGAFGTGAKPIITGLIKITGWVNLGNNIWEAPTTDVKEDVNLVLRDDAIQQVGRYPNSDAKNKGYLAYTASTSTSLTGPALSPDMNWTGAEIAVRLFRWEIRRRKVISHSGGVVTFANMADVPKPNCGYFFQRDPRTLDQDGEWFQNGATNKLSMYFANNNPGRYTIQVATIDTLFNNRKSNISISNLSFAGAGKAAIMSVGGRGIVIKNCDANNNGADAITAWFCTNVTVEDCTTSNSLGSGIKLYGPSTGSVNLTVKKCTVDKTALVAGMETTDIASSGNAIFCNGGNNIQILNNIIRNSGYNGINWKGNNVYIKYNLIDSFCSVRDDGGGIYTYVVKGNSVVAGTNRNIVSNIILNGISAPFGTPGASQSSVVGVYMDEGTRDVIIDSNTIANIIGSGIHGNGNGNIIITNNTTYHTIVSCSFQRLANENPVRGIVVKKNIFYPYRFRYRNQAINLPTLLTKEADMLAMGTIDSNYYSLRPGADTSLSATITWNNGSHYNETHNNFQMTGASNIDKHSTNVENSGTLEYNAGSASKVVSFPGLSKKDVFGNVYNNSVTIPPWSSKVLIPNGTASTSKKPR